MTAWSDSVRIFQTILSLARGHLHLARVPFQHLLNQAAKLIIMNSHSETPPAQTSAVKTQHQHSDVPASRNYQEESTQAQARQHETKRRTIVYSRNPHRIFKSQQEYDGFKRKNHQPLCTMDKQVETTGDSAREVLEGQVRAVGIDCLSKV